MPPQSGSNAQGTTPADGDSAVTPPAPGDEGGDGSGDVDDTAALASFLGKAGGTLVAEDAGLIAKARASMDLIRTHRERGPFRDRALD